MKGSCVNSTPHTSPFSRALVMICHTTLVQVFVRVIPSMCHAPWVIVCSLFDPHFALFICLFHLPLHPPELLPFPLPCGCVRSKIPCALRPMRSLALWPITPLSQVMSPTLRRFHYSETTEMFLQEPSSDTRPSYLHDSQISDDTIGIALSSPLFTQERQEPAGCRQAYHSLEESLLPSQWLSVCHVRTGRPVHELCSLGSSIKENPSRDSENEQIRVLLERQKEQILVDCRAEIQKHDFEADYEEDVSRNWMELSSLNEEKLIVVMQETNNFDEINNFFTNNYWNKIVIFVKFMWKVSMRWKHWSDFKGLHSIQCQEEDWSKIETLSLNSLVRFRNYRMKLIVWMIREILKMLNQYAVDNPTLPVNLRFFPPFQDPAGMPSRSLGMPSCNDWPPIIWYTQRKIGKSCFKSNSVFFSTLSTRVQSMGL